MIIFNRYKGMSLEDVLPLLSIKFAANHIYRDSINNDEQLANVYNDIRAKAVQCLEKEPTKVI